MATPMTPSQIRNAMRAGGISFREPFHDWETHNRGDRGNGWSNLNGIMVHHTGSDSQTIGPYLYRGTDSLPGPLCQFGITSAGHVEMIGWGRANHAGSGDVNVLERVIAEDYSGILRPRVQNYDGNGRFYGIECYYNGSHGMTPAMYRAVVLLCTVICEFHGWTAKSVIGHGEWSIQKWDPGYANGKMMDMAAMRDDIASLLRGEQEEAVEAVVEPERNDTYDAVMRADAMPRPKNMGSDDNPYWTGENMIRNAVEEARDANKGVQEVIAILKRNGMV